MLLIGTTFCKFCLLYPLARRIANTNSVSNNMSSTTSVAGGSGASGKDNKVDTSDTMSDTMGARDGVGSSGAPAVQVNEADKVVDVSLLSLRYHTCILTLAGATL